MLEPPAISVPLDSTPRLDWNRELSAPPRFPHTRAQLAAIARQYRPLEAYDDDEQDGEISNIVTSALVTKVASLLDNEHEDELKTLLKDTFSPDIDDDEVCFPPLLRDRTL